MKKFLTFALISGIVFTSCDDSEMIDQSASFQPEMTDMSQPNNRVTLTDIENLYHSDATRSTSVPIQVECIIDSENDTLLYAVDKKSGGWTIYSSDSRVPAIVAESSTGNLSHLMQNESAKAWIHLMAKDLKCIKRAKDAGLRFSKEEIENNRLFWRGKSSVAETRTQIIELPDTFEFGPDTLPLPPGWRDGHYELREVRTYIENYDSIPRLITTDWSQGYPYNIYCPLTTKNDGTRAPAGCVAIAAGQLMYYLHENMGIPVTAPSKAYCNGDINNYSWEQYDYSSDVWESMKWDARYAAPMIADIGRRVGMQYGNYGSSAFTSRLVSDVLAPYGVQAKYVAFNSKNLNSSLTAKLPVIARATDIERDAGGHAFIIDRYKRTRMIKKYIYEWVYDHDGNVAPNACYPQVPVKVETRSFPPEITMVGMNWGWGPFCNNGSEWYSLTGDWIKRLDGMDYNWFKDRYLIYVEM